MSAVSHPIPESEELDTGLPARSRGQLRAARAEGRGTGLRVPVGAAATKNHATSTTERHLSDARTKLLNLGDLTASLLQYVSTSLIMISPPPPGLICVVGLGHHQKRLACSICPKPSSNQRDPPRWINRHLPQDDELAAAKDTRSDGTWREKLVAAGISWLAEEYAKAGSLLPTRPLPCSPWPGGVGWALKKSSRRRVVASSSHCG
jgi:hypothetical protein